MRRTRYLMLFICMVVLTWLSLCQLPLESTAAEDFHVIKTTIDRAAKLEVNTTTIIFLVRHADTTKEVPANENDMGSIIRVRTVISNPAYLGIIADGDLVSESGTIPIENVIWQASGDSSSSGFLSKSISKRVGVWTQGGTRELVLRFFLKDCRNYPEGAYRGTVVFTLASP